MKTEIYDITGMHCSACSSAIERVTRKLDGVSSSEVNLPMNRLTIVYDETKCDEQKIIAKIKKAGFDANLHTEAPVVKEDKDTALKNQKIELIVSIIFAGVLFVVSMGTMMFPVMSNYLGVFSPVEFPVNFAILQMLLCIPVLLLGKRFFTSGFSSLIHLNPNMDTLVAISVSVAFIYSVVNTLLISIDAHYVHNLYYESASMVIALVSVGKYMEQNSKEKTKDAITKLMNLVPETALLVDENGEWEVPTSKINVNDTILVKTGAKIPLDGVVIKGNASVNESMLTGESLPIEKAEKSEVVGGSICENGAIYIKVTRIGKDTTLSKIIKFVEDAQSKKAPISRVADKVAGVFVPIVITLSLVAMIIWLLLGQDLAFALKIFTSTLVIACPCAMGLATPMAMIVGTGLGANNGILIRNGEVLENAHNVKVAIFDKTGTVTQGKPKVTDIISDNENECLINAYAIEKLSDHPLSKAVCEWAVEKNINSNVNIINFDNVSGKGICGTDDNANEIIVGNEKLYQDKNIDISKHIVIAESLKSKGKTVIFVAKNKVVLGVIAISDTVKESSKEAIEKIKSLGIKTVLLTGDNKKSAQYIGEHIGFDEIIAEVLPEDKANVVMRMQKNNTVVMMVGDGINDAPALTKADVGCAIGSGSDIAIDCAEIVLMKSDLHDVYKAIHLSKLTLTNIKQNLFWAFIYNILALPLATGVLYSSFGILLNPMIGSVAMSLSSLFVVSNALRLKYNKHKMSPASLGGGCHFRILEGGYLPPKP